jgi:hypothetical protein
MRDLTSFASMKLKAALFVVIGLFSGALLVLGPDFSAWQRALLLAMCVWAFCRAYYFAFYVIEKYVNSSYRFSGLVSAMSYLARSKLSGEVANTSFTDPPSPRSPGLPKGWWLLWTFTIGLACIVPILHLRENTRDLIEPLRHPWGLLPSSWLGVWTFEKISWYVLAAVLIAGVVAWSKPSWGRAAILLALSLYVLFSSLHVLYISRLLVGAIRQQVQTAIDERARAP